MSGVVGIVLAIATSCTIAILRSRWLLVIMVFPFSGDRLQDEFTGFVVHGLRKLDEPRKRVVVGASLQLRDAKHRALGERALIVRVDDREHVRLG